MRVGECFVAAYWPGVPTVVLKCHVPAGANFARIIAEDGMQFSFALRNHKLA
jgi:hypothetical protein